MMEDFIYVFECPVHGSEVGALCFRAFDDKLLSHWVKYQLSQVDFLPGERDGLIAKLNEETEKLDESTRSFL